MILWKNRPYWLSIVIFTLVANASTFAQMINGTVLEEASTEPLHYVSVRNNSNKAWTQTDSLGQFSIKAQINDTLYVSYIGYRPLQMIYKGEHPLVIRMQKATLTLSETIITPRYTPYQRDSIKRHPTYKSTLNEAPPSVLNPFSLLASAVSKKSREKRKFRKSFYEWEKLHFINTVYTDELVYAETGLTGDSIAYFKNMYPMEIDFAYTTTSIELRMWVRYHFRQWKAAGYPLPVKLE